MIICSSRDAAQDEIRWHRAVPAVRERLFQADQHQVHEVGQQVEAEEIRGQEGRDEAADQVGEGVVVGGAERVRRGDAVVPCVVEAGELAGRRGFGRAFVVQDVAMQSVGDYFADEESSY